MGWQSFLVNFLQLTDAPKAIARLRELILQLAVEGTLVHQDDREESAFRLVERIEAEKVRLAKETGLNVSQTIPVRKEEIPYVLPSGWLWSRLTNIGLINPRNNFDDNEIVSFVPMNLIPQKYGESLKTEMRYWRDIRKGYAHFAEGDVVLAKITPCFQNGKAAVMRGLQNDVGAGTTELHVFRPIDGFICPDYVLAYLKSPKFLLEGIPRMTGTAGQKRVPNDYFAQTPFPLPPLAEQRRIVAKIEELMQLCDQLEARQQAKRESRVRLNTTVLAPLNKAASLTPEEFAQGTTRLADNFNTLYDSIDTVSKLRATILQLAVQGKLEPQDPNDQTVRVLLAEINGEKERQIKAKKSKQIEPLPPITEDDFLKMPTPKGWHWAWLGDLARFVDYRGKTPPKTESGVRLLTAKNVRMGFISEYPLEFVSEDTYNEVMTRGLPGFGDILFTTEAPLGNVAQLLTNERVALAQRVIDLQTFKPLFAEYLKLCLMSPLVQKAIIDRATGMTATGIKASKLKKLPVPVPPLAEQRRIVAKVNQLMSLCDELEAKLRQAEADSEKLMNAAVKHVLDSVRAGSKTAEEHSHK